MPNVLRLGVVLSLAGWVQVQASYAANYSGTTPWSTISQLNIHSGSIIVVLDTPSPANGCASPTFRASASISGESIDFHRATLLSAKYNQTEIALRYDLDDVDDCKINIDTIYLR